jgi:predicted DNA-binding protein YlxM (UPF0122 family)
MKKVYENFPENRAKIRKEYRDRIDLLISRVSLLDGKDKLLMTMYIDNGNSFRQMARLTGVNESNISRRIHIVTNRLMNGEYITCLRNREKFKKNELDIAREYFLEGQSIKKIAQRYNSTYYSMRKTIKKIQLFIELVNRA